MQSFSNECLQILVNFSQKLGSEGGGVGGGGIILASSSAGRTVAPVELKFNQKRKRHKEINV